VHTSVLAPPAPALPLAPAELAPPLAEPALPPELTAPEPALEFEVPADELLVPAPDSAEPAVAVDEPPLEFELPPVFEKALPPALLLHAHAESKPNNVSRVAFLVMTRPFRTLRSARRRQRWRSAQTKRSEKLDSAQTRCSR
jgi:hypothetical protein